MLEKKQDFVREIYKENGNESYERHLFEESRLGAYVLAGLIGATIALSGLIARDIYQSIIKEKPTACDSRARR
jgi:hypothetical protein